jgi:hypothetical protein
MMIICCREWGWNNIYATKYKEFYLCTCARIQNKDVPKLGEMY